MTESMTDQIVIDEVTPDAAYDALESTESAVLIDVRTSAEWDRIGVPDISATGRPLWFIEWVTGPDRTPNPAFLEEVLDHAGGSLPGRMLFICRSGPVRWRQRGSWQHWRPRRVSRFTARMSPKGSRVCRSMGGRRGGRPGDCPGTGICRVGAIDRKQETSTNCLRGWYESRKGRELPESQKSRAHLEQCRSDGPQGTGPRGGREMARRRHADGY